MRLRQQILRHNDFYSYQKPLKIRGVMVHSTGADNPNVSRYVPGNDEIGYNKGHNHWDQPGYLAVHAFIGKFADGGVGTVQTLPWSIKGAHCGYGDKGSGNDTHISFEICEDDRSDPDYFKAVYQEAVELTAYLCDAFCLDPLEDGVVICHSEGHTRKIASNHGDVMHWFPKHGKTMDDFRADVARILNNQEGEDSEGEMTQEKFNQMMDTYLASRATLPPDGWSENARKWAEDKHITVGDGSGNYRYKSLLTKEEVIQLLYMAMGG